MATIYRFIVEQKTTTRGGGRKGDSTPSKGGAGKRRTVSLFGGGRGGVEHNRYMRAINPVLNRATGGAWEKGMRLGRAGMGLVQVDKTTGAFAGLSMVAITIIISFVLQAFFKKQQQDIKKAQALNARNYKMLENGVGAIHGEYEINVNMWNGRQTYNQNK